MSGNEGDFSNVATIADIQSSGPWHRLQIELAKEFEPLSDRQRPGSTDTRLIADCAVYRRAEMEYGAGKDKNFYICGRAESVQGRRKTVVGGADVTEESALPSGAE